MTVIVERVPNEPIVIVRYASLVDDVARQTLETSQQIMAAMHDEKGIFFRIIDLRPLKLSFSDLARGLAEEARSGLPGLISDPRVRTVIVGSSELVQTGQSPYGNADIKLFVSLDGALVHARAEIARQ
jgi:hypothetical protein